MDTVKAIRKENINYLADNKKYNSLDLELYYFKDYLETKEGKSEQENYLLSILEKEVNALRETIETYKKELDNNHFTAIEQLKKED